MRMWTLMRLGLVLLGALIPCVAPAAEKYVVDGYASPTSGASLPFFAGNEKGAFAAEGVDLVFPPSAGADGTIQRLASRQSNMTYWVAQAIRATANGSTRVCIVWLSFEKGDSEVIAKQNSWTAVRQYAHSTPNAVHLVGGLDRTNTLVVEHVVAEHKLETAQKNIDGSDEPRMIAFIRDPKAVTTMLSQPWVSAAKHFDGVFSLESSRSGLLAGTPIDGLAVPCDDLKQGTAARELHKKVLKVVIQNARWIHDPANKQSVLAWIEANIRQRKMLEKVEANRGDRAVTWKTADPVKELSEEVYRAAVNGAATHLAPDAPERVHRLVRFVLGKEPTLAPHAFFDFSLAQEVLNELDGIPAKNKK